MRFIIALLFAGPASAAPFLVCDPYPPSGPQPTEFVISIAGQPDPVIVPATATSDGVALKWDLAGRVGPHTVTVKARNDTSESGHSEPFSFQAGPVSTPSQLRVFY